MKILCPMQDFFLEMNKLQERQQLLLLMREKSCVASYRQSALTLKLIQGVIILEDDVCLIAELSIRRALMAT